MVYLCGLQGGKFQGFKKQLFVLTLILKAHNMFGEKT